MIDDVGNWITRGFDLVLRPVLALGAMPSLLVVSTLAGVAMLWVFRRFSDQRGLRVAKSRMMAGLMALNLYRASPGVLPRILVDLGLRTLTYLRLCLPPLLILAPPLLVLLFQLEGRYSARPLRVGEAALVSVIVTGPGGLDLPGGIALHGGPGLSVETPPVRVPSQRRAVWRVRAAQEGTHEVRVSFGGTDIAKRIVVGGFPGRLLQAGERPLDASSGIEAISVAYPALTPGIFGLHLHWLTWFLLISAATALALKGFLRVSL